MSILESYAISDDIRKLLESFIQSAKFEKAIRRLIWRNNHVDAISAITGSITGEYYNIPQHFSESTMKYLDESQIKIIQEFLHTYYPIPQRKYDLIMYDFRDNEYILNGRRYYIIREQLPLRFKVNKK